MHCGSAPVGSVWWLLPGPAVPFLRGWKWDSDPSEPELWGQLNLLEAVSPAGSGLAERQKKHGDGIVSLPVHLSAQPFSQGQLSPAQECLQTLSSQ